MRNANRCRHHPQKKTYERRLQFLEMRKKVGKPQSKWKKKLNELFYPEKCIDVPDPKGEIDMCAVDPSWPQPRVLIIGAGMAGLSTAQRLLQCGIQNFLILEATDRPGGRIHSRWMDDCVTELGAMYIEGASIANLVFLMARQEGLLEPPLNRIKVAENTTFFSSGGRTIEQHTVETALQTFRELIETKAIEHQLVKNSASLGDFIQDQLSKDFGTVPGALRKDMSRVIGCLYNELRSYIGQDPCWAHSESLAEKEYLPGGRVRIPLGFGSILAPLLRTLPPCSIMYCKPVHYIMWGGSKKSRATVVCSDKEEFPADYVVVTVPLGVLKNELDQMFIPALPKRKQKAIEKLCFGEAERVLIQYERPFWVGNSGIALGWTLREIKENTGDWRRGLGELTVVPGGNATLQGTVGGASAVALSETPQARLIPEVGELMRQFTGDNTLSDPKDVQRSRWTYDPFFNGAYTYLGLASKPSHFRTLAEPVWHPEQDKIEREARRNKKQEKNKTKEEKQEKNKTKEEKQERKGKNDPPILLFAGEATSLLHFATVHGARESGIREAQRIIEHTKTHRGPPISKTPCPPCRYKPKTAKK